MQTIFLLAAIFGAAGWIITGSAAHGTGTAVTFLALCAIIAALIRWTDKK